MFKRIILILFIYFGFFFNLANTEIVEKIITQGNERISSETINVFSGVLINDDLDADKLDLILKEIYSTGFFQDVSVIFKDRILTINVIENSLIQNISYDGIKAQKIRDVVLRDLALKPRSSYNELFLEADKKKIINSLKDLGYYFSTVEVFTDKIENNKMDILFKINLGEKANIKKISFIGNKIFKENKLKRLIISEEYKFWKFISQKKYLNESIRDLDIRLLKNYYLNQGFYNVNIKTSFAKLLDDNNFELIFNIDAGNKIFFNDLKLNLPAEFDANNFKELLNVFDEIKGEPYSIYSIQKILDEIDQITLLEEYQSINSNIDEEIVDNKLNIIFNIEKSEDSFIQRINIYGNTITHENVIRNNFLLDEGDPYNEILKNKTLNQLKSLNFFKNVSINVQDGDDTNSKILDINVEEKPTGEIGAAAGVGTSSNSFGFFVRENNFLGKGIKLDSNLTLATDSITGSFSVENPNILNSDKSLSTTIESTELDKLADYGYKTQKTGFIVGTTFEYRDDLSIGLASSNYYQNIETVSSASEAQKKQRGDYLDSYLKLDFDYDKRNQKFQTTSGFRSFYSVDVPLISDTDTLINSYNYQLFSELYEDNITSMSVFLNTANSITGSDVKLSERLYIPQSKLRGFKAGSVGPKDGNDYIGGNFVSTLNIASTLPQIFENSQNTDFLIFFDAANVWHVDYDSSINDNSKIRSSIGVGVDWLTPIGPLNFSLSQPITKSSTDMTETFRFNLGTTF